MISMVDPTPRFDTQEQAQSGQAPSCSIAGDRHDELLDTARGMGWFSIGLGAAQILTPGLVGVLTGVRNPRLLRAYGFRELICGLGILNSPRPAGWMWARVAGDAMDFATLLEVVASGDEKRVDEAMCALVGVVGAALTDAACASALSNAADA